MQKKSVMNKKSKLEKDKKQMDEMAQEENYQGVIAIVPPFEYVEVEDILNLAKEKLISALNNLNAVPLDLIAIDIKDSWESMGEISGKTATEDIINEIFSRFCVGK